MPETLELIPAANDREWTRRLEPVPHDFYHTAAYHQLSEGEGEGEAFLAVYGSPGRYLAWPYLLRPIGQVPGRRDVTSVYGYAGPLSEGPADESFLARAHQALNALWRSQNAVSAFTRFHPLLENHHWGPAAGLAPGGETISLDLSLGESENWSCYQSSLRNRIHRARHLGLVTAPDPSWSRLEDFVAFYDAAMRRNRAAPYYFFPLDYFQRLRRALGDRIFLMLTRQGDRIAAASIVVEHRGLVQNHFCVNNEACLHLAPSKVLLDDVRRWAQARGNRVFHLGGGRGSAPDGLFAFKAAFSPRRHRFHTGRWVLDRRLYEELSADRPPGEYFPAYRSPHDRHAAFAVAR